MKNTNNRVYPDLIEGTKGTQKDTDYLTEGKTYSPFVGKTIIQKCRLTENGKRQELHRQKVYPNLKHSLMD